MNFEYVSENGLVLRSAEPSLFLKAHIKGYTRGDGVFVAEHDDSRPDAQQKPAGGAKANSGHAVPAGLVSHADSAATDSWYKDTTKKLSDAGYQWHGFDAHGGKFSHPEHGTLHVQHGLTNPDKKDDRGFYSRVVHGDQPKPAGGAEGAKAHAIAAGAKHADVFSDGSEALKHADDNEFSPKYPHGTTVLKHPDHPHFVVADRVDAVAMKAKGYKEHKASGAADHSEVLGLTPETPDQTKDHALAAGAKSRSNVAVFSSKDAAHRYADRAMNSKGSAFVMKHDGHPHHVVVSGADAQRMARNGYKHVK